MSIYDFEVTQIDGSTTDLSAYKNKVILILNTATHCTFTKQYSELEELYEELKDRDFIILDFPCNQFMNQAPEEIHELHDFCVTNYNITFPQFNKVEVNGENSHPLFAYLKDETQLKNVKWNFTKFLIDREGNVVKKYNPTKKPMRIKNDILELL